ncbi:Segregation and condensation protein [Lentibacillus sp. JNUCC-1]|uniref:segregation/condensation protein A n=1 Tax=Lentibacillus sp. JNUCC-1 TaxID=2654513 RepID=UPI0012E7E88D|nr:segregation/condensation protein A [Lentibacillus sp. JNUCC-1]MUV39736.1 Segregation and condensation protein [Lentibacillus sp. JNUCC-1]
MSLSYEVKLDAFEGPLDLLLHLIYQYEIDIYDIPVAQITEQYMGYIHAMQQLELNVASEYLVMASTLLALKSQMLLPKQEFDEEDEYEEDPRQELMEQLIEYKKYKEAAKHLEEKENEALGVYTRPPVQLEKNEAKPLMEPGAVSIYDMLDALAHVLERQKWNEPLDTTVQRTDISIEDRMDQVLDMVKANHKGIRFDHLFDTYTRSHIVVTFIAVLELMKHNSILCEQKHHFDPIIIYGEGA